MTTLATSHNIYLTRQQRYELFHGVDMDVVGVSVPVWITNQGKTTEPAVEVFARYKITNRQERIYIKQVQGHYEITIPPIELRDWVPPEEWNLMSKEEQEKWYARNEPNPSLQNLLDIKDGGSEYLAFRQYSKVDKETGSIGTLHVIHYVEIKDMEELTQTLA